MAGFNPFKSKPPVQKPNRNAFDLSFANNLTMEFGKLYPVMCKEVIPGDTFDIDTTFGLRFMPLQFPVQTRMRADLHFFYVRNRNLWSDWKDFYGRTKENLKPPYLNILPSRASSLYTGSLLDYLGVPTTLVGKQLPSWSSKMDNIGAFSRGAVTIEVARRVTDFSNIVKPYFGTWKLMKFSDVMVCKTRDTYTSPDGVKRHDYTAYYRTVGMTSAQMETFNTRSEAVTMARAPLNKKVTADSVISFSYEPERCAVLGTATDLSKLKFQIRIFEDVAAGFGGSRIYQCLGSLDSPVTLKFDESTRTASSLPIGKYMAIPKSVRKSFVVSQIPTIQNFTMPTSISLDTLINQLIDEGHTKLILALTSSDLLQQFIKLELLTKTDNGIVFPMTQVTISNLQMSDDYVDVSGFSSPFINYSTAPAQPLSALPSRAYESIYNSFYRNQQVTPFKIGGVIEYNKFIPTDAGGADSYPYDFHYRDWEDDFLTTCLPSPQQGVAPLVGAMQRKEQQGVLNYFDSEGNEKQMRIVAGQSGDVSAISVRDGDLPESTIKSLNEAINFGISINDFRNVNALQRWLEKNIRRGYRYKDQILSHFGVNISYEACDMPEYIGGVSQDINVSTINQTSSNEFGNLGDQGGIATCLGSSRHKVSKYFDEHGFVMAILSVSPIPSYSQLLPKHFTKFDNLDYFTSEFNHIGMQPVPYREVSPLQQFSVGGSLDDTFGYQRAWYDYLASVDEVHGQFRTNLRNYLVNRVFAVTPELGEEFLKIDPQQVNDIFTYRDNDPAGRDKIIGQLYFKITAVRPISKFGEPRLE